MESRTQSSISVRLSEGTDDSFSESESEDADVTDDENDDDEREVDDARELTLELSKQDDGPAVELLSPAKGGMASEI